MMQPKTMLQAILLLRQSRQTASLITTIYQSPQEKRQAAVLSVIANLWVHSQCDLREA